MAIRTHACTHGRTLHRQQQDGSILLYLYIYTISTSEARGGLGLEDALMMCTPNWGGVGLCELLKRELP